MKLKLFRFRHKRRSAWLQITPRDCVMVGFGALVILAGVVVTRYLDDHQVPLEPQTNGITIQWVPASVKRWNNTIEQMAQKYDIDPNLIAIIMTMESAGNPKATSEAGAQGLMQITPPTAQDIARKFLKKPVTSYNLYDPATSIEFGAAYLAYLRTVFGDATQGPSWNGTVELIAAGYNGGPGAAANLEKGNGLHDTQTVVYSRDAFNMWRERHVSDSPTFDRWVERGGSNLINSAQNP